MNAPNLLQGSRRRAFTLLECIVYMSVFAMLLGMALMAFYRCYDHMQAMRRNTDDIGRALHAGEIWRADIRSATNAIQFDVAEQTVRIPCAAREVSYRFSESQVLRRANADSPWAVLLPRVQVSQMQAESRTHVTACRWDLELQTKNQPVRTRPLFTFLAVPTANATP
jgi:hypothetical protein